MLIQATTSSKLTVQAGTAGTLDCHVSWVEATANNVSNQNQLDVVVSSTTETDITTVPGGSTVRGSVQHLSVRNSHASVTTTVTLRHKDGTNSPILFATTLAPSESLIYEDGAGWLVFNTSGAVKTGTTGTGQFISTTTLTASSGTHTVSANTRTIRLRMVGGGGAGGSAATIASGGGVGGGGGAGGYAERTFTTIPSTGYSYTCGAAGAAGATGANSGGNGGSTTFTVSGTTVTANGGNGGTAMAAATTTGVALGGAQAAVSTNGSLNGSGAPGGIAVRHTATVMISGAGGSGAFGAGDDGLIAQGSGVAGTGFGAGGSGGATLNGGAATQGGAGTAGCIVVEEFS